TTATDGVPAMTPPRRPPWAAWVLVAGLLSIAQAAPAQDAAQAQPREMKFLQGLRERGYHDLATEYVDRLRKAPDTPADLKAVLDYEEGHGLLEEAASLTDLDRRREVLEQARTKLDAFAKAHPDHALASEALVQMARLLLERGVTASLQATEETANDK